MSDLKTPCVPISKIDVKEGFNARTHMDEKELNYGTVWDNSIGRNRRTKRVPLISEARNLRTDLLAEVRTGVVVERTKGIRLEDAHREFIADCRAGVALNKRRKPYTTNSIDDLDSSLKRLPDRIRRKYLDEITAEALQLAVDDLGREGLSGSRINSVFNSLRSLYRWALGRGKATHNPAGSLELPAEEPKKEVRIATPGEFAYLLEKLEPQDALPWALAGYATARSQEIRVLEWPEVDFENDVVLLAGSEEARKSEAARRIVPLVKPLRSRLQAEWIRQGEPKAGMVCPPRAQSKTGLISLDQLQKRRKEIWISLNLEPIGLHDSRHTAVTWMDHAGVSPKVVSVIMGHKAPGRQLDAAPITLQRYTHVLPGGASAGDEAAGSVPYRTSQGGRWAREISHELTGYISDVTPLAISSGLAVAYAIGLLLLLVIVPMVVTALKAQWLLFVAGWLTVGLVWWIAALRLGRPSSWWARNLYGEEKLMRAERRYGTVAG